MSYSFNPFTSNFDQVVDKHSKLKELLWSEAGHTFDTDLDLANYGIINLGHIVFDTSYTLSGSETVGTTYWDAENKTISTVLEDGVIGQHFQESFIVGQNDTGSTLEDGTVATYLSSIGNSGNIRIGHTTASASEPAFMTLGIITSDILNGNRGNITTQGKVRGIQTDGANYSETWVDADILYKSSTVAGGLTNVAPEAPIPAIPLAVVIAAHASNGTILVRPTYPTSLDMLTDVNGTTPDATNKFLVWDNANEYWDANTISASDIDVTDTNDYYEGTNVEDILEEIGETRHDNGFDLQVDASLPDLAFVDGTRTFTTSVKSGSSNYYFWTDGHKHIKTGDESVVIPDITGTYYIIFDNTGTLVAVNQNALTMPAFYENAITGLVYWNATAGTSFLGRELHGYRMSSASHEQEHNTLGARYSSGMDITGLADGSDVYTNISSGVMYDEDIRHAIALQTTSPFLYRLGADGAWTGTTPDLNVSHNAGGTYDVWNEYTGSTWQLSEGGPTTDYWIVFLICTPDIGGYSYKKIIGQGAYANRSQARNAIDTERSRLVTDGLPSPEFVFVAAWIVQRNGNLEDDGDGNVYYDLRTEKGGSSSGGTAASIASDVVTDVTNFDNNLSATDVTVQDALDTLDDLTVPTVSDTAYDATSWDSNTDAATKNAIRDKIEALPVAEYASIAETDTGTEDAKAVTPDGLQGSKRNVRWLVFDIVGSDIDCATGTNLVGDFVSPIAGTILQSDTSPFYLYATNSTAGVETSQLMTIEIEKNGTSIFTTDLITIDTAEKTSTTAATPPNLTTTTIAVGDIITIDIDRIHATTAAKGLKVYMAVREA